MDQQVLEAAATWYVRLNAAPPNAAELQAWREWLVACPQHQRAWARVEKLNRQWSNLPGELALSTLAGAQARRRAVLRMVTMLLAAGGGGWLVSTQVPYQALLAQQSTAVGQRKHMRLEDGSELALNTDTAVDVAYSDTMRQVTLYRGEILIQTARDPRPFVVQSPHGSVRALGTRFTVRCEPAATQVCVLEKAVELRPLRLPAQPARVLAGEQAHFDREHTYPVTAAPLGAGAWVQGMMTVMAWPLGVFIVELGRYRPGVLRCAPDVADLRVSGAFSIDHTDAVLENLGHSLPVRARYLTRYWVTVEAA